MRSIAHRRFPHQASVAHRLSKILLRLELALQVRRERRMLGCMSDRALKDIGLDRATADGEARRPFWDLPDCRESR